MEARMKNPAIVLPEVMQALMGLGKAVTQSAVKSGLPVATVNLAIIRASQINGCSVCLDMHRYEAQLAGETEQRLFMVSAWREAPYFTDAERAALALAERMTRLSDRAEAVPDEVYYEAARHFEEPALAALITAIASINLWNRLNIATRQITGDWVKMLVKQNMEASHAAK